MRIKPFSIIALLYVSCLVNLFASELGTGIYDIRTEVKNNDRVVISWKESIGFSASLTIYRSPREITDSLPASAQLIAYVPAGIFTCIDEPDGPGPWYYLVIPESRLPSAQAKLPLATNITQTPVYLQKSSKSLELEIEDPLDRPMTIRSLHTKVEADSVHIFFQSTKDSGKAILYRSTKPVRSIDDLVHAVIVQIANIDSPFVDYPVPGIECWYTVIMEDDLRMGQAGIFIGENSSAYSVEVDAGSYRTGLYLSPAWIRSMPLPLISQDSFANILHAWPKPASHMQDIGPGTKKAVSELLAMWKGPKKRPILFPQVFGIDSSPSTGGEAFALYSIVKESFLQSKWTETADSLQAFLSLPHSLEVENRARFYLAQTWYYRSDFRLALFEFLLAQRSYPSEGTRWVQDCLYRLALKDEVLTRAAN